MKTDITVLLDRSGSMSSIREDIIGGFNTFLAEQKALPGDATLSLAQFDSNGYDNVLKAVKIADAQPLSLQTFQPRGGTPLLWAMKKVIDETGQRLSKLPSSEMPEKVVVVIITDGQENTFRDVTKEQVTEMVTHQRDVYKWEFVYLGANQDAIAEAAGMGIPATHAATYAATPDGANRAYGAVSASVGMARSGGSSEIGKDQRDRLNVP